MKDLKEFISILEGKYQFKTKEGTLCITYLKYIEKMIANYEAEALWGVAKQNVTSTLEKGDHPEF